MSLDYDDAMRLGGRFLQGDSETEFKNIPEAIYEVSISLKSIAETLDNINTVLASLVRDIRDR